ncbi:DUF1641 domain-containing protein [Bacillus smithii]|uniref:DUF1641 domain-containing protein n=1 Tax=Bacillus smithii TaxID=1479 RepID=UPI003D233B6A
MSEPKTQPQQKTSSGREQLEFLEQLLTPEVQESLIILKEQLPKLVELISVLTEAYSFAKSIATDEVLKKDTIGAIQELAEPVKETVKTIAATAIEANDRAEASNQAIGVFGLLKLLKDPQVQKIFRFIHAYLEISGERKGSK